VDAVSKDNTVAGAYSLVLANPPFKGTIDQEAVAPGLLLVSNTKKTELLFLALILRMLKSGGRCAVIVPDGVLFGSSKGHVSIREELVDRQKLEAVISMPSGVFKPYAGVSTAILIFTKTDSGGTDKVWFYDMCADGMSLDDKRNLLVDESVFTQLAFPTDADETEQARIHNVFNIPDILARFPNRAKENRARTEQSFWVAADEIRENKYDLSINRYKEVVYEEKQYDSPQVILERIETLDGERQKLIGLLREMLGNQSV
jgi:type I restriction enzyme M protein